jgi:hypothetical protein
VFVPLERAVGESRSRHRDLLAAAADWAVANSESVDLDVLALVCAAAEEWSDEPLNQWTRTGVTHLLSVDTFNWCSTARGRGPAGIPGAVWSFLDFLAETGRLDPTSEPLPELCKPLICYGGLDELGRRRADPARSSPASATSPTEGRHTAIWARRPDVNRARSSPGDDAATPDQLQPLVVPQLGQAWHEPARCIRTPHW